MQTVGELVLVVVFGQVELKHFHQGEEFQSVQSRLAICDGLPEYKTEYFGTVESVALFSDQTGSYKLFDKEEELLVGVLVLGEVGEAVEIAEVRVDHLHYHNRVERNVHLESLTILIPKLYEPIQRQSLLISFLGSQHGFENSLLLLLAESHLNRERTTSGRWDQ